MTTLLSTAIYIVGTVHVKAAETFLNSDENIDTFLDAGFKKVINNQTLKNVQNNYKLSDKGDMFSNYDPIGRREFYMLGDGNCALYSMGTNYQTAHNLFLQNSNNAAIRDLAYPEIVDAFAELPATIKQKRSYIDLNNERLTILELLNQIQERDLRLIIQQNQDDLYRRIAQWAKTEEIYKDYVTYHLTNGRYMTFFQDGRTCFLSALAHLLNKNLIIWTQGHRVTREIINHHPGNEDRHPLYIAHQYIKVGATEDLEIIHRGNHFNRVVPVTNPNALQRAAEEEQRYLSTLHEALEDKATTTLLKNELFLEHIFYEKLLYSNDFSEADKAFARTEYLRLQKAGAFTHKINPATLKSYCTAAMAALEKCKEDLIPDTELNPEATKQNALRTYNMLPLQMKNGPRGQQMLAAANKAYKSAQDRKQAAVAELQTIKRKISIFKRISNPIKLDVSDAHIFDALSQLIFSIGQHNEALLKLKEQKAGLPSEMKMLEEQYKHSSNLKKIYEGLQADYQKKYIHNLSGQIKRGSKSAEQRVKDYLKTNPSVNIGAGYRNLADEFNLARNTLEQIAAKNNRRNQPHLNPLAVLYDPFLSGYNRDIHIEYPENIEWDSYMDMLASVKEAILKLLVNPSQREKTYITPRIYPQKDNLISDNLLMRNSPALVGKTIVNNPLDIPADTWIETFNNLQGVFNRTSFYSDTSEDEKLSRHTLRKRIKRVLDYILRNKQAMAEDDADPEEVKLEAYALFGALMGENHSRCIDGVSNGVERIESQLVFDDNSQGQLGKKVSKLIINDRHLFILQHREFTPAYDVERRTGIPELLLQRMRYVMSLKGNTRELAYPGYGNGASDSLSPAQTMKRYLKGEPTNQNFKARTPDYLADLLYTAHMRSLDKSKEMGEKISREDITEFAQYDPFILSFFNDACNKLEEAEEIDNPYFDEYQRNIRAKKQFFVYLLERLGYVINPTDSRHNPFQGIDNLPERQIRQLLQDSFNQQKNKGVPQYTRFDNETENKIIELATSYVRRGIAEPGLDALEFALEKFAGYERIGEVSNALNQLPNHNRDLFRGLSYQQREKIVLYTATYLTNGSSDLNKALQRMTYTIKGERFYPHFLNMVNQHHSQLLNRKTQEQVLEIAGRLAAQELLPLEEQTLTRAIKKFWSENYKFKLLSKLKGLKEKGQILNNLGAVEEKRIIKTALKYVEQGLYSFKKAVIIAAQMPEDQHDLMLKHIRFQEGRLQREALAEELRKKYIEAEMLPAIRKISSHAAYRNYETFMTTKGTGYLPGMDLNDYWQEVWAEKAANLSISRKPAFDRGYIEKVLLPEIRKISSHEAYRSYEAFMNTRSTGYTPGMDLNNYWQRVWSAKAKSAPARYELPQISPARYELPQNLLSKEAFDRGYIEKVLLPEIRKISSHEAYRSYEAFMNTRSTGYTPGMDLNDYWQEVWAEKAKSAPARYELPWHLLSKEAFDQSYIEKVLLPEIRKISNHAAYRSYDAFMATKGTGYTPGMDLNNYWQRVWSEKAKSAPARYELPWHLLSKEAFDRGYIEKVLLPEIRKISSHEAYRSYEAFMNTKGTGYTPGMDLNNYWQRVWSEKAKSVPELYELPKNLT